MFYYWSRGNKKVNASGDKFSIHAHCNQPYKRQYIIDNFDGTKQSINNLTLECKTTTRFVYKVLEERVRKEKGYIDG